MGDYVGAAHIGSEVNGISAGVTVGFSWAPQYGEVGPSGCPFNPRFSTTQRWTDHVSLVPTNNDQSFSPHDKEYIYSHLPAHSAQALRSIDVRKCEVRDALEPALTLAGG